LIGWKDLDVILSSSTGYLVWLIFGNSLLCLGVLFWSMAWEWYSLFLFPPPIFNDDWSLFSSLPSV